MTSLWSAGPDLKLESFVPSNLMSSHLQMPTGDGLEVQLFIAPTLTLTQRLIQMVVLHSLLEPSNTLSHSGRILIQTLIKLLIQLQGDVEFKMVFPQTW